ncbi:MAG: hypothetical protein IH608_10525 [Proteobacteria bacterium]|nr:hypothetical protein [Pseudomonadota bacterium]
MRNLARSLIEGRSGSRFLSQTDEYAVAEVEAESHFLTGVVTRYRFWADRELWLPVRVQEEVPGGGGRGTWSSGI